MAACACLPGPAGRPAVGVRRKKTTRVSSFAVMAMAVMARRATAADRAAILGELSRGIYDGHDYLPFVFDRWLADPTRACFVAEEPGPDGGRLVGFEAVGQFDQGQCVARRGFSGGIVFVGVGGGEWLGKPSVLSGTPVP